MVSNINSSKLIESMAYISVQLFTICAVSGVNKLQ